MGSSAFDYQKAFDRNLGWLTDKEQEKLRHSRVAIAGVGGAGGFQAQALARLGVCQFHIADLDTFEMTNMNRQIGATMSTLGKDKCEVMKQMILDINPEADVKVFAQGINEGNIDAFLEGIDLALDGIDIFEIDLKRLFFKRCANHGITALTCGPFGFGVSLMTFLSTGMSFDAYFDFNDGLTQTQKRQYFIFGMNATPFCLKYMDRQRVMDGKSRRGASVSPGLLLVGAVSGTEAVKILTGKGKVNYAPHIYQIDMFTQQMTRQYFPFGQAGAWQRFKRYLFSLIFKAE